MWSSVCLIGSILFTASEGCTLNQKTVTGVTAYPDESVLLPCSCSDLQDQPPSVSWQFLNPTTRLFLPVTQTHAGRIKLFNGITPSNLSLLLTKVTEDDQGIYRCMDNRDNTNFRDVRITVRGCALRPPITSETSKYNNIKGSHGQSILLACSCRDLKTRPKSLLWEFYRPNLKQWDPVNLSDRYGRRVKMFNDENTPGNLSLLLSDLTKEDERFYRCIIQEQSKTSFKDILLSVQGTGQPKTSTKGPITPVTTPKAGGNTGGPSEEDPSTVGGSPYHPIIYVLVAGLSLMILVVGVSVGVYRRNKDKKSSLETSIVREEEQKEDDFSVVYDTIADGGSDARMPAPRAATDDPSLMYSTIVHPQGTGRGKAGVGQGGGAGETEYASVKTGRAS